jgi:pimeloyl-ACP methyl ester carboxylesterase
MSAPNHRQRTSTSGRAKAALYGTSEGGPMTLLFAAAYPDRAIALVLYGSYARHPPGLSAENIDEHIAWIERAWGTGEYLTRCFMPSRVNDLAFLRSVAHFERQSAGPSAAATIVRMQCDIDTQHVLSAIRVPTLVLHRVDDERIAVDAGQSTFVQWPLMLCPISPGSWLSRPSHREPSRQRSSPSSRRINPQRRGELSWSSRQVPHTLDAAI